jgi:hypothetical protein
VDFLNVAVQIMHIHVHQVSLLQNFRIFVECKNEGVFHTDSSR